MSFLITVIGATGIQGSSVVSAFKQHKDWRIRGVSRDVQKAKSSDPDIEWIQADANDESSLIKAFAGSTAVFCVTQSFDESLVKNREQEIQQGINMANAAHRSNVSYLIWSCLPDTRKTSHGSVNTLKHTYMKHEVTVFIQQQVTQNAWKIKPLFLLPASYMQNYLYRFPPKKKDGTVIFSLPASADVKLDVFNVDEWGPFVFSALNKAMNNSSSSLVGQEIVACAERITGKQMASTYAEVTDEPAEYKQISDETFLQLAGNDSRAKELLDMFHYYDKYGLFGVDGEYYDLNKGKQIYPLTSFKQYLQLSHYKADAIDKELQEKYQ